MARMDPDRGLRERRRGQIRASRAAQAEPPGEGPKEGRRSVDLDGAITYGFIQAGPPEEEPVQGSGIHLQPDVFLEPGGAPDKSRPPPAAARASSNAGSSLAIRRGSRHD